MTFTTETSIHCLCSFTGTKVEGRITMSKDCPERWLPVPDAPTYLISDQGNVKTTDGKAVAIDNGRFSVFYLGIRSRRNVKRVVRELFPDIAAAELSDPGEIWRPIPEHPGFDLSNVGRVRRTGKIINHGPPGITREIGPKVLKEFANNGYRVVTIGITGSRDAKMFYIEKALMEVFPELSDDMPPVLPGEEWRFIRGYENLYLISNLGRVFSLPRLIDDGRNRNRYVRSRLRIPNCTGNGYPKVELARDGETDTVLVHRLVAEAFVPNPNQFDCVHHRDEDKLNSKADNLEWVSRGGNVQDWFDRRRVAVGVDTIEFIQAAHAAGKSTAEILAALPRRTKRRRGA